MEFSRLKQLAANHGIDLWQAQDGTVYQSLPSGYSKKLAWLRGNIHIARHFGLVPKVDANVEARRIAACFERGDTEVDGFSLAFDTVYQLMLECGMIPAGHTLETCNGYKDEFERSRCMFLITKSEWV